MTPGLWKKMFIAATLLLVIFLITNGILWYQLNATAIQLYDTTVQLYAVKPGMDTLKAERDQILSSYADMRKQINLRLGIEQDSQFFITPDAPEITAKVQEITDGYSSQYLWRDYGRLYMWIVRNIKYSQDSSTPLLPEYINGTLDWRGDFWRLPDETLRDETGDCEDMALLLTSMLLNYNERQFPVWIVGVRTFGLNPEAHVAVAIPSTNNQLTIFDLAAHYYTKFPIYGGFGSEYVPVAIFHWLEHLEKEMPGAEIYLVFSENFYQEFSGTQEFVDWASKLLR